TVLSAAFGLWGLHHLDYPFLRARGSWVPWGYYLDIMFALAVGAGILLLVFDDLRRGLAALSALSGDLQRAGREEDVLDALLARPLALSAVTGTALYTVHEGSPRFLRGAGVCLSWQHSEPSRAAEEVLLGVIRSGRPQFTGNWSATTPDVAAYAYTAVLPILQSGVVAAILVLVGQARDPFTALDEKFLLALGHQVGAALENADLYSRLQSRTNELARLSSRMVQQHENERRRLSRELHDETAQVFSAVKMELGLLREKLRDDQAERLDQVLGMIDTGIRSIRNVTNDLRPSLLDDLGLLPALRSLAAEFAERSGIATTLDEPSTIPTLSAEAELALFRCLQEALTNVLRHAQATSVEVAIENRREGIVLRVTDNGRGLPADLERNGHMGLAGMRERIASVGGTVRIGSPGRSVAGTTLEVLVPTHGAPA
ncbi:MAG TPA: GAF domain-containing sensor histidine kinase, partial [Gemmatimonadales bacterium]|nr:GAF domain-containing sensor histidine kinase [Gemmatimonadales bacterium]